MTARQLNKEKYNRLKMATRLLNQAAGGVESAAMMTRVKHAQIGVYQNINADDQFAPIDVIADLEAVTGEHHVTRALCSLAGGYFVPHISTEHHPVFAAQLANIGKEFADIMQEAASALSDGELNDLERRRLITQIEEGITALATAKAMLDSELTQNPKTIPIRKV